MDRSLQMTIHRTLGFSVGSLVILFPIFFLEENTGLLDPDESTLFSYVRLFCRLLYDAVLTDVQSSRVTDLINS